MVKQGCGRNDLELWIRGETTRRKMVFGGETTKGKKNKGETTRGKMTRAETGAKRLVTIIIC